MTLDEVTTDLGPNHVDGEVNQDVTAVKSVKMKMKGSKFDGAFNPVSYTHLDVYKRQVLR